MKPLKFRPYLVKEILEGRKTVTWRLFDDKDLKVGDELELINYETGEKFGNVVIVGVEEKKIKDLSETELKNHGYKNLEKMIETHKNYYGDKVDSDTMVKIIKFKLIK